MKLIPIQAVPNQALQVDLDSQPCVIEIIQYAYGLFLTLYVGNSLIVAGVICENRNRIVRSLYLGFSGDLTFVDLQPDPLAGPSDPIYTGLGSRFQLVYLEEADLSGEG